MEVFDPRGLGEGKSPLSPKLKTVDKKSIALLPNGLWQSHRTLPLLKALLEKQYPSTRFELLEADSALGDKTVEQVASQGYDAVIVGNAACGRCAAECGRAAAKLEQLGIPTVLLARQDFVGVIDNTVSGFGFAQKISKVTFPMATFMTESDISAVEARFTEFISELINPRDDIPKAKAKLSKIRLDADDYENASSALHNLFLKRRLGDGLPLLAPTEKRVGWVLEGTDLSPGLEIGCFGPRGGTISMETLAIALAMAGGRPEYLPILEASVRAVINPALTHEDWQSSSSSTYPVIVVNGKAGRDIHINSGFGLIGPDPKHPAGATIGRALRLLQQNVGGALPGVGTMALFGLQRHTNAVFAEDEEGLPQGWSPFHAERFGLSPETNSVSVNICSSASNIFRRGTDTDSARAEAESSLWRVASYMRALNANSYPSWADGTPGVLVLSRPTAAQMAALGWTKASIREFLWKNTHIPLLELERAGMFGWLERGGLKPPYQDPWPITSRPENIAIVVAGGGHPAQKLWMQSSTAPTMVCQEVHLPQRWQELVSRGKDETGYGES